MEYTIAQLEAGLADARFEYVNARKLNDAHPSVENFQNVRCARARIERINVMIAEA